MSLNFSKTSFVVAMGLLAVIALWASPKASARGPSRGSHGHMPPMHTSGAVTYTCPMHPEVASGKPGKCPKCGMFLEAKTMEKIYYTCPMHADVKMDKPGKCPKCGMNLKKKTEQVAFAYTCPMHPDVKSDKPGKCPKCGMFLEAQAPGRASADASGSPAVLDR